MPYKSIAEAKKANFPTTAEKVPLTLAQINHLARIYDGVKKSGSADNPMAVAWARWKRVYTKTDGKWKLKEGKSGISDGVTPQAKEAGWIPVAKVGQEVRIANAEEDSGIPQTVYPTAEGFEKAVELFTEMAEKGYVGRNHLEVLEGMEVTEQKFEFPFLYAKFNQQGEAAIKDPKSTGRSIDATVFGIEGHLLTDFLVPGVSVLFDPHNPACSPEMGCSSTNIKSSSESKIDFDLVVMNNKGDFVKVRDVNMYLNGEEMKDKEVVKSQLLAEVAYLDYQASCMFIPHNPALRIGDVVPTDVKPLYTIQIAISAKGETEVDYHEGGGKKKMVEKEGDEPAVTFTEEQVKERIATAESEVAERLDNAHAVVVTDLEKANETKIAELGTEHETAIEAAKVATMKQAEARATFMHNFGLKEDSELMKSYDGAKTIEELREVMTSMEMPKAAAAAVGISSAGDGNPGVEKIEEIGGFNARKGAFDPTYRGVKK